MRTVSTAALLVLPFLWLGACSSDDESVDGTTPGETDDGAVSGSSGVGSSSGASSTDAAPTDASVPDGIELYGYASGSRLRARIHTDGVARLFQRFEDVEFGPCESLPDANGTERCLPGSWQSAAQFHLYFRDDACTQPVAVPVAGHRTFLQALEEGRYRVWAAGDAAPNAAPVHRQTSDGRCVVDAGAQLDTLSPLTALEPTRFVELVTTEFGADRLRMRGWRGSDGSWRHTDPSLFDTVDQSACMVVNDRQGELRCMRLAAQGTALYADATCESPLVSQVGVSGDFVMLDVGQPAQCGRFGIYPLLEPYLGPRFAKKSDRCESTELGVEPRRVGSPLADSQFQSVEQERVGTGRLLRESYHVGQERFLAARLAYDNVLQVACGPGLDRDGRLACIPFRNSGSLEYLDANCSERVFVNHMRCQETLRLYSETQDGGRHTIHRLGEPVDTLLTYRKNAQGECAVHDWNDEVGYVTPMKVQPYLGEEDPNVLQPLQDVVE